MPTTTWKTLREQLKHLWPGVDPYQVASVLQAAHDAGDEGIVPLLEQAIAIGGANGASLLMAPIAATFPTPDYRDRADTPGAVDALIRAGGDPGAALTMLAQALEDRHSVDAATRALRRAVLAGFDLSAIRAELESQRPHLPALETICALAFAERTDRVELMARFQAVYAAQRYGNLRGGIELVELLCTSEHAALGDAVLDALSGADGQMFQSWLALVPAFQHVLRHGTPAQIPNTLRAMAEFRYAHCHAGDLPAEAVHAQALPVLTALLTEVAPLLDGAAATYAATVVAQFVLYGADASDIVPALTRGLTHPAPSVRNACSRALSRHRQRTGAETPLPPGCSWRRRYAASDTPLNPDAKPATCEHCGADEVRTVYEHNDGMQFYSTTTWETHCAGCGVYEVHVFQAPG